MLQTDIGDASKSKIVEKVCEEFNDWQIEVRRKDVERLNTAGFLTEFGAVDPKDPVARKYLSNVMDKVDDVLHSWTYWYIYIDEMDSDNNPELKTLAR